MKQSELMNILDDVATGKVTKEEALLAIKEAEQAFGARMRMK